jgi:hypothetical protein
MRGLVGHVKRGLRGLSYPFPHARGPLTLAQLVEPGVEAASEPEAVLYSSLTCHEQLFPLYDEALGRLAQIAARVEEALAPDGLP